MNKAKASYLNIAASLFQQMIGVILGFVSRMLFIHILGTEVLGLNNTFESVLGTLALADLGIQRAITFSLYKPFQENDYEKINSIITIYKWFYRLVGFIVFIGSVMCIPFLPYIITGFEFKSIFILYFMLQAVSSSSSYLLAYKRVLFYVDQRDYIIKLIDASSSFLFLSLKICILYMAKSYIGYLLIQIVQTVLSNVVVHLICTKKYPYITNAVPIDKTLFNNIWGDMKEVIWGKLASFVYDSTDNLVISAFVNTIMVGMLGNYVLITSSIKKIINSIVNPFAPIIGRMIADGNKNIKENSFELCTHFSYIVAMILLVPTFGLINKFIGLWIGNDYLMALIIPTLLVVDLFIFTMQGICCSYIFGEGLFTQEKYIDIMTALMNLFTSIILVRFIGVAGVLIGTVISEIFMWVGRSYVVYFYSVKTKKHGYRKYWEKNMIRIASFVAAIIASYSIGQLNASDSEIINFIIDGILIETLVIFIYFINFGFTNINKQLIKLLIQLLRRK